MTTMRHILFLLALPLTATDFTVCASGCSYDNLYVALAAVDTVLLGDRLILKAGENYDAEYELFPRTKVRAGTDGFLRITTSALASLPPIGTRVSPSDAVYMPKIRGTGGYSTLRWEIANAWISTLNAATGVINLNTSQLSSYSTISVGTPVTVREQDTNQDVTPFVSGGVYWVTTAVSCGSNCLSVTLSATVGGPTLAPITFPEPGPGWGRVLVARVNPLHHYIFQGLDITYHASTGGSMPAFLQLGNHEESAYAALPYAIEVDRCYIHRNILDARQVAKGIQYSGSLYVHDSYISGLAKAGGEAIGMATFTAPGPLTVTNNYIESAGINFILGGGTAKIRGMVNGERGGTFRHNYSVKSGFAKARQSASGVLATPPALDPGGCLDDESYYYTNISQGWICTGGVWVQNDAQALIRVNANLNTTEKNQYEYKSAKNMIAEGNIFKTAWPAAQPGECFLFQSIDRNEWASPWTEISSTTTRGNWCQNTSGMAMFQLAFAGVTNPNKNNLIENNLWTRLGSYGGTGDFIRVQTGQQDISLRHNTIAGYYGWRGLMTYIDQEDPLSPDGIRYALADMILPNSAQLFSQSCASAAAKVTDLTLGTFSVQNAASTSLNFDWSGCTTVQNIAGAAASTLFVDEAGGNYRVSPSSVAYHAASDGKDVGADIDYLDAMIDGVVPGTPSLMSSVRIDRGSTHAVVRFTSPSSCSLALYTDPTRTTLSTDTTAGANQLDSRTGNVISGSDRQFVLGTVSALTPSTEYWYLLTCGSRLAVGSFRTLATGSAATVTARHPAAVAGEYSASASMSSPTAIPSGTIHSIPVDRDPVYYRATGGAINVLITR